jgi:UDP-GlcNAc:undecaprenyl-phosphate/decaprenyl-phosphate GlcNAc-1-phosphate transferase
VLLSLLVVAVTAGVVTAAVTPAVAALSRRIGALDHPGSGPRKVHTVPVPTLGGLAMLVGFAVALGVAWLLPAFRPLFLSSSEPLAVLVGAIVIVLVGIADDLLGLPPTVKLAGQIVAGLGAVLFGVQLVHFWIPGLEVISLSPDLGLPLTIIALVAMINAVNLIDGLDGLAAGVVAIAAIAFLVFTLVSGPSGLVETIPTVAPLVVAALVGMCLGFLVHNFHPARIFMGDTGSMLLGLLLGSAGVAYVGRTTAPSNADFYGSIPLLIPALVLAIPFLDSAFAVARRMLKGQQVTVGDRGHLHHLLIAFGHSHQRAVLVLYYWSALLAVASVGPGFVSISTLALLLVAGGAVGIALIALGVRTSPPAAEPTATPDQRAEIG